METNIPCPKCKKGLLEQKARGTFVAWFCSYTADCGFLIPSIMKGKMLSENVFRQLAIKGETGWLSKFESEGGLYKAKLELNKVTWKVEVKLPPKEESASDIPCYVCKDGSIVFYADRVFCNKYSYKLFRQWCGKKLEDRILKRLLKGEITPIVYGFTSKKGHSFRAKLKLDDKGSIVPIFEN